MKKYMPDAYYSKTIDIPFADYVAKGYKYVLFDLDNTIAPDHSHVPVPYSFEIVKIVSDLGMKCCLVSNAKSNRSEIFAKKLDIPFVSYAAKPSPKGIIRAMRDLGADTTNTMMVGDQFFTDIIAGKRAKIHTIWVKPYESREVFYVRFKRPLEFIIRKLYGF
ncbi:MAG TPA: YqeG family HAD IIIA-type phosphatase [Clostridiaceae bacterium]|jgi:HAD superfamily phosphatase (TIGR01668 family)|nr:YqeG family HAD IIIA-type phosphatase [Clostridiaceae bacterium]